MSAMRSRMRSRLTRPSARASGAPTHAWIPKPNPTCWRPFGRSIRYSAGSSNRRGHARQTEVALDRTLDAHALLDEARNPLALGTEELLEVGTFTEGSQGG